MFVNKHFANFPGKLTLEILGLRNENFQDIIIWTRTYGEVFKPALVYL